jgi:nucleoside-triphosphatase THEP1
LRRSPEYPAVISNAKPSLHTPLNYGIDKIAVPSMLHENDNVILVVDEIGKMECFPGLFRQTLMKILDATNTV